MKKRFLSVLATSALVFGGALSLTACTDNTEPTTTTQTENDVTAQIQAIYQMYAADGGTQTYEQWLASIKGADGATGAAGAAGKDGVSITGVAKTSTDELVDTYTITFSNGTTTTYTVTNGKDGVDGSDGANGTNGTNGADGVSISKIEKTSTDGLEDTYTITFSDETTTTFTVNNGKDGEDGAQGIQGIQGATISSVIRDEESDTSTSLGYIIVLNDEAQTEIKFSIPKDVDCNHVYDLTKVEFVGENSKIYKVCTYSCEGAECDKAYQVKEYIGTKFNGGDGSVGSPFEINTPAQFMKLSTVSAELAERSTYVEDDVTYEYPEFYYVLTEDITLNVSSLKTGGVLISNFSGHLIGGGKTLTAQANAKNTASSMNAYSIYLFNNLMGEVSFENIECEFRDVMMGVWHRDGNILIDNVNISNTSTLRCENNESFYIAGSRGSSLTMKNCKNEGTITSTSYVGAFIGGYCGIETVIDFENLEFSGIINALNAGMLMGNEVNLWSKSTETLTITNCVNKGVIQGSTAGLLYSKNPVTIKADNGYTIQEKKDRIAALVENFENKENVLVNGVGGSVVTAKTLTVSADSTTKLVSCTDSNIGATDYNVSYYTVEVYMYGQYFDNATGEYCGTQYTVVYSNTYDTVDLITDVYAYTVKDYTTVTDAELGQVFDGHYVFKEKGLVIAPKDYTIKFPTTVEEYRPTVKVMAYDSNNKVIAAGTYKVK